jgi:hypothetical protein
MPERHGCLTADIELHQHAFLDLDKAPALKCPVCR